MRHLTDPTAVDIGIAAWVFLLVVCVLIPLSAIHQHRQEPVPRGDVAPSALYVSGLVTHAVLLLLVWLVARSASVTIFPAYRLQLWHVGVGALSLAMSLALVFRNKAMDAVERQRAKQIAPRTRKDLALFYVLSVSAGFTEEMAYRGVLFLLLHALTGSFIAAAILGGMVFGVGHLVQGPKASGIAALMGVRDHVVAGLTGTLWIVIAAHILHDMIAGTVLRARMAAEPDVALAPAVAAAEMTNAVP